MFIRKCVDFANFPDSSENAGREVPVAQPSCLCLPLKGRDKTAEKSQKLGRTLGFVRASKRRARQFRIQSKNSSTG
jgi:hypothetical protein